MSHCGPVDEMCAGTVQRTMANQPAIIATPPMGATLRRPGSPVTAWWYREPQNIPIPAIRRVPACGEGRQRRHTRNIFKSFKVAVWAHTNRKARHKHKSMDANWKNTAYNQSLSSVTDDSVLGDGKPTCPEILAIKAKCFASFWLQTTTLPLITHQIRFCLEYTNLFGPMYLYSTSAPLQSHSSPCSKCVIGFNFFI